MAGDDDRELLTAAGQIGCHEGDAVAVDVDDDRVGPDLDALERADPLHELCDRVVTSEPQPATGPAVRLHDERPGARRRCGLGGGKSGQAGADDQHVGMLVAGAQLHTTGVHEPAAHVRAGGHPAVGRSKEAGRRRGPHLRRGLQQPAQLLVERLQVEAERGPDVLRADQLAVGGQPVRGGHVGFVVHLELA